MKPLKDAIYDAFMFGGADYKEMDLNDISLLIQDRDNEYKDYDLNILLKKVSSFMANHTSKIVKGERKIVKGEFYERVPNGKGGYRKGVYRLRKPSRKKKKPERPIIIPIPTIESYDTNYIGSAGEMAVCSELLFREYNVSQMSVDDGVDVVAIKNGKTFYIQVKTTQVISNNFSAKIQTKSFERYNSNDCYYIVVARAEKNMYLVFTADDIKRMISNEVINKGEKLISLSFTQQGGHIYIKSEKVDYALNSFDRIV